MNAKYTDREVGNQIAKINQEREEKQWWILKDGKLYRQFVFSSFVEAFAWMTAIAIHAEKLAHHPEWFNVYNRVDVYLTTHDAGGITALDFELATVMNDVKH